MKASAKVNMLLELQLSRAHSQKELHSRRTLALVKLGEGQVLSCFPAKDIPDLSEDNYHIRDRGWVIVSISVVPLQQLLPEVKYFSNNFEMQIFKNPYIFFQACRDDLPQKATLYWKESYLYIEIMLQQSYQW